MFMDEVEQKTAEPELAAPEPIPQEQATEVAPAPKDNEENLRVLRQRKKEAEKRAQELEYQLKLQQEMFSQAMQTKAEPVQAAPVDELDSVPDEDYIPKGQVKKLLNREREEARKIAQEEIKKQLAEQEKSQFLNRLNAKFSDFNDVVNPETLELLEQQDPELAQTILEIGDPYKMGLQSYKYIKSMGLLDKVPDTRRSKEIDKKIEQNEKTVPSPLAYEKRPMAQTFQLTEKHKQDLYNEMIKFAQMAG
jgi:hypothetical protein